MTRQDWRLLAVLLSDRAAAGTVPDNRELMMSLSLVATTMAKECSAPADGACEECGAEMVPAGVGCWTQQHAQDCPTNSFPT
jgi:hypothetical protein